MIIEILLFIIVVLLTLIAIRETKKPTAIRDEGLFGLGGSEVIKWQHLEAPEEKAFKSTIKKIHENHKDQDN